MKKFLTVLLVIALLVGVERLSHFLTDGFGLPNITSNLPFNDAWSVNVSAEDKREALIALDQEYIYLESGSQSYVFMSQDGKYVIKFFKHKRWRLNPFFEALPLPASFHAKRERWKKKKKETVESTFTSCVTSYQHFKDETGLFYVHLNPTTELKRKLIVKDPIGLKHKIHLDKIQFLLQRTATPTDTYLLNLKEAGNIEGAKKAIVDLLHFTVERAEKGYSDKDPHLIRNFGFINDKVVEIDVGGFHRDPKKDLEYFYSHEIYRIQKKIVPWLNKYYPELSTFAEEQIQEVIHNKERNPL